MSDISDTAVAFRELKNLEDPGRGWETLVIGPPHTHTVTLGRPWKSLYESEGA